MLRFLVVFAAAVGAVVGGGCSVYMAANQPAGKNMAVLTAGQPRSALIAEFGPPVHSETTSNGRRKDIFTFVNGYNGAVKAGRAILHGAADVATLGLWEAVGTPIEGYAKGTEVSVEVTYDAAEKVATITPLKGGEELVQHPASVAKSSGTAAPETSALQ